MAALDPDHVDRRALLALQDERAMEAFLACDYQFDPQRDRQRLAEAARFLLDRSGLDGPSW